MLMYYKPLVLADRGDDADMILENADQYKILDPALVCIEFDNFGVRGKYGAEHLGKLK